MIQIFADDTQFIDGLVTIEGQDAHHVKDVLRKKIGDQIQVCSNGCMYLCEIVSLSQDDLQAKVIDVNKDYQELPSEIVLYQGLPKGDKMELIIQKAVELGAVRIVPVAMKNCVVKLPGDKAKKKVQRWQKIAESAAKQSHRSLIPQIGDVMTYEEALNEASKLDLFLLPYEHEEGISSAQQALSKLQIGQTIGVMIGPEGGYDPSEIEKAQDQAQILSLGKRILRTETAGLTTLSILMYHLEILAKGQ